MKPRFRKPVVHQNVGHVPFDLQFFQHLFPEIDNAQSDADDQLNQTLEARLEKLTPSETEKSNIKDLVDATQTYVNSMINDSSIFTHAKIQQVSAVGQYLYDTIVTGHNRADMVVSFNQTKPTRTLVQQFGQVLLQHLKSSRPGLKISFNDSGFDIVSKEDATLRVLFFGWSSLKHGEKPSLPSGEAKDIVSGDKYEADKNAVNRPPTDHELHGINTGEALFEMRMSKWFIECHSKFNNQEQHLTFMKRRNVSNAVAKKKIKKEEGGEAEESKKLEAENEGVTVKVEVEVKKEMTNESDQGNTDSVSNVCGEGNTDGISTQAYPSANDKAENESETNPLREKFELKPLSEFRGTVSKNISALVRLLTDLRERMPTSFIHLTPFRMFILAHHATLHGLNSPSIPEPLPLPKAFRRVFEVLSAGLLLPGSIGIQYPIAIPTSITMTYGREEQEDLCMAAQTILKLLAVQDYQKLFTLNEDGLKTEITSSKGDCDWTIAPCKKVCKSLFKSTESLNASALDNAMTQEMTTPVVKA